MEKEMSCFRMLRKASSKKCEGPFNTNWAWSLEPLTVITPSLTLFDVPGMLPCAYELIGHSQQPTSCITYYNELLLC